MAARFNTRFALILAVVVVAAVAVVGGLAVLRMRADAERHIKAGDAFMQSGNYREALGAYGRAVSKKPGNADYLEKMQGALVKVEPKNRADTENLMRTFEGIQDRRASLDPGKGANYLPLLEYWRAYADEGDVGAAWDRLRAQADRMVKALEERKNTSDPDYVRGRLERGVAVIRKSYAKSGAVLPTAEERKQAVRDPKTNPPVPGDLEVAAAQYPDEAYSLLARQAFDEAERLRLAGQTKDAESQRTEGERYLKAGLEATEAKGPRLRTLAARRLFESKEASSAELDAAVIALLDALRPVNDRWVLLEAEPVALATARRASLGLEPASREKAMQAALEGMESIYRKYLDRHPDDLVVRVELADLLVRRNKFDEAIAEAQAVIDRKPLPFGIDALLQRDRQVAACSVQIEALVAQWEDARVAGETDVVADRIKDAKRVYETMKLLADNREDEPLLLLAQGNVLFMEDKLQSASEKFEAYVAQVPSGRLAPVLVLDRAFITAAMTKKWKIAQQHYKELGVADPSGEMSRRRALDAALVYLEDGDSEEAKRLAELHLEKVDADSVEAKRVKAEALRNLGESTKSLVDQESAEVKDTMARIGEFTRNGEFLNARVRAEEAIKKDPKVAAYRRGLVFAGIAAGDFEIASRDAQTALNELPDMPDSEREILETVVKELDTDSEDPIEMSKRVANILASPFPEGVRPIVRLQIVAAGLSRKKAELAAAERAGVASEVATLNDQVQKFIRVVGESRLELDALPIKDTLETRFRAAQAADNLEWMSSDLTAAEKSGAIDPVNLVVLQAAYEVTRARKEAVSGASPDLVRASRLIEEAIKSYPRNPKLLETMAEIKELGGDRFGAMTLYGQAVEMSTPRGRAGLALARLQAETGDRTKALATLKAHVGTTAIEYVSVPVREQLLALEADVGGRRQALEARKNLNTARSDDIVNNVGLAALLVTTMPRFDDIVDVRNGEEIPRYTEATWKQLPPRSQQEQLQKVRESWRIEANTILDELRQQAATDDRAVLGAAQLLQMPEFAGLDEAKQILQARVDRAGDKATAGMWVDLGRVAVAARDADTANRAFATAQSLQDPVAREVDRELGRIFLALSARQDAALNLENAERHLRAVLETNPTDVSVQVDLAQCLVQQVGRQEADLPALNEADALLKAVGNVKSDPEALLLQAQVELLRGERASRDQSKGVQERWDDLRNSIEKTRPILASARRAQGGAFNPRIPATEARMLYGAWLTAPDRDNNPEAKRMMGDAESILDKAIAEQPAWELVALRQQLRVARQDFAGAKKALIDFVNANPDEGQARQTLIALLVQTQDIKTALDVARVGAELNPATADWPLLMHEIAWNTNRREEAIEYGEWAYRLEPERAAPFLVGSLINRGFNDDFQRVVQITTAQKKNLTDRHAFMLGAQGAARVRSGPADRPQGIADLKASYAMFQKDIAQAKSDGGPGQSIGPWYNLARIAFVNDPKAVQQLAEQAKGSSTLAGEELRALAGIWSQQPDPDSRRQGLLLYQQALGKLESEGASAAERAALLFDLGTAEFQADNCSNAIERYEQGLKLSDAPQPALENNLAYLYYVCNQDLDRSLEHSEKSVRQAPGNPEFLDTLGELYLRKYQKSGSRSDLDEAERRLTQGLIVGNLTATRVSLAEVLIEKGLNERANAMLREVLGKANVNDLKALNERIKSLQDRIAQGRTGG